MNASPYFGCAQCALAPITNKDRIRMDHLLDLGASFHLEILRRIRYPTVSINRQARHEIVSIQNASAQMGSKDSISRQGMVYETEKFF